MTDFWTIAGDWGFALAAALYTVLTLATARRSASQPASIPLVVAYTLMALWALQSVIVASMGTGMLLTANLPETMRNAAWIGVLWVLLKRTGPAPRGTRLILSALGLALLCQLVADLLTDRAMRSSPDALAIARSAWVLRAAFALGAIALLQGLFRRLADAGLGRTGWLCCALAILWAFEFNHYVLMWISDGHAAQVGQMRGILAVLLVPLMMLATGGADGRAIALSRRAVYRVAAVLVTTLYAIGLLGMVMLVRSIDDPATRVVQMGAIFALSVITLLLLPSASFRAWIKAEIARHLFTHRYDYRHEWARFAESLGHASDDTQRLPRRAARALANAVDAPAALLFLRNEDGRFDPVGDWHWSPDGEMPTGPLDLLTGPAFAAGEQIVDLASGDPLALSLPMSIAEDARAWALVPLSHGARLVGAALVARPPGRKAPDWEDIDMLRVVGRQLAVTLSEWQHQQARVEAQRFEEFNRRFAFILHDIKNLVSQISLLASNAERHAANPDFRADMILTLKDTATRMNDLIARLARPAQDGPASAELCDLAAIAQAVARNGKVAGRVELDCADGVRVRADEDALRQSLIHLVHNAVEATPPDGPPVILRVRRADDEAVVEIIDKGVGMSADFLRNGLFRPFTSTKANGFGLGAHEARALINAMGGRLEVRSEPGEGSCFTICLELGGDNAAPAASADGTLRPRKAG